jgi:hypothetical protein
MNPEQQAATDSDSETKSLPAVTDTSLTLAAKKLAGSEKCLNCGTGLKGPFCYYCGQPDRNFMRFFPALLRDLMEDLLDLDSRFMRTIKPLLFKPGRLTRDYMEGRRFRYAPPMRLYIFSSIVFFLLAAFLSTDGVTVHNESNEDSTIQVIQDGADQQQQIEGALNSIPADVREQIDIEQIQAEINEHEEDEDGFKLDDIQFNEEPWDRETNPVDIKWLPMWLNDRINDEIEGSPKKAEQISENPNLILDKVFDLLPATMFILLPLVALILKFWYLFAKRYYVEHLIYSLHIHSFMFVSLILILLESAANPLLTEYGYPGLATAGSWFAISIGIWIPVYMLISLRVVYQQGWLMTIGKSFFIGFSYLTLLIFVTASVAIASFVLL